jgi:hypothetical protein
MAYVGSRERHSRLSICSRMVAILASQAERSAEDMIDYLVDWWVVLGRPRNDTAERLS